MSRTARTARTARFAAVAAVSAVLCAGAGIGAVTAPSAAASTTHHHRTSASADPSINWDTAPNSSVDSINWD
ncbi:hypothetical protein ACFV7Q_35840 [Streptomyces sp. NPDC059851]|uniref:hypothetical protein n=1 Tax=Streptomyces sp. NPDC059851 TaxID=3346971 RepID=UPI00364CD1DE